MGLPARLVVGFVKGVGLIWAGLEKGVGFDEVAGRGHHLAVGGEEGVVPFSVATQRLLILNEEAIQRDSAMGHAFLDL